MIHAVVLLLALSAAPVKPAAPAAPPNTPANTIRAAEKQLRTALLKGAARSEFPKIASQYADYDELARRSLGAQWDAQKPADQAAIVKALRALLEETYLTRMAGIDPMYAFIVEREEVRGDDATVWIRTQMKGQQAQSSFKMKKGKDGRWRIYDLTVAGLAILAGYQEQLPQLLALGGMPKLLQQLEAERKATAENNARNASQAPPPKPAPAPAPAQKPAAAPPAR